MSCRGRKLIAACLLALWLVATQHCGLEALGLFAEHAETVADTGCCAGSDQCERDDCHTLENGGYRIDGASVKVAAPRLTLGDPSEEWIAIPEPEPLPDINLTGILASALDWVPTWQFVRRAAAPAHAPDDLNA